MWLVLDTNTLMQSPEELLAFHSASKDSILPKSGAFKNIDLSITYYIPQAVIRELDNCKAAGQSAGDDFALAHYPTHGSNTWICICNPDVETAHIAFRVA